MDEIFCGYSIDNASNFNRIVQTILSPIVNKTMIALFISDIPTYLTLWYLPADEILSNLFVSYPQDSFDIHLIVHVYTQTFFDNPLNCI
jgi:hypothetical protein